MGDLGKARSARSISVAHELTAAHWQSSRCLTFLYESRVQKKRGKPRLPPFITVAICRSCVVVITGAPIEGAKSKRICLNADLP
jgi:hypothetical protein